MHISVWSHGNSNENTWFAIKCLHCFTVQVTHITFQHCHLLSQCMWSSVMTSLCGHTTCCTSSLSASCWVFDFVKETSLGKEFFVLLQYLLHNMKMCIVMLTTDALQHQPISFLLNSHSVTCKQYISLFIMDPFFRKFVTMTPFMSKRKVNMAFSSWEHYLEVFRLAMKDNMLI